MLSNGRLLALITTDRVSAKAFICRLLLVAVALVSLDFLLAFPAFAQQPLYVGDFDGPSERNDLVHLDYIQVPPIVRSRLDQRVVHPK